MLKMLPNAKLLSIAGSLIPSSENRTGSKRERIDQALEDNNLGIEETIRGIRQVAVNAEKDETRLKAYETAAKLNGMLVDEKGPNIPTVNIIIQGDSGSVNSIFLPTI